MLSKKECEILKEATALYEYVAEIMVWDIEPINNIEKLSAKGINELYNEDDEFNTAEGLFLSLFTANFSDLNKFADEF